MEYSRNFRKLFAIYLSSIIFNPFLKFENLLNLDFLFRAKILSSSLFPFLFPGPATSPAQSHFSRAPASPSFLLLSLPLCPTCRSCPPRPHFLPMSKKATPTCWPPLQLSVSGAYLMRPLHKKSCLVILSRSPKKKSLESSSFRRIPPKKSSSSKLVPIGLCHRCCSSVIVVATSGFALPRSPSCTFPRRSRNPEPP